MKLSTAIRIGSMTTKQIKGQVSDGGNGRCAIGAALDAAGVQVVPKGEWISLFREIFPAYTALMHDIWTMNDGAGNFFGHPQTREAIADYVERWENEHDGYISREYTEAKPLELIAQETI